MAPLLSFILPVRNTFNRNIATCIQPTHNRISSFKHELFVEGKSVPVPTILFSLAALGFGFAIVYLLPKGMIDEDLTLLLVIFLCSLVAFQTGLIQLCFAFLPQLEKLVARTVTLFRSKLHLQMVINNLSSHRLTNRRTELLYTTVVAFIVFFYVLVSVQLQTVYAQMLKGQGCLLEVRADHDAEYPLLNRTFYDGLLRSDRYRPFLKDFAYRTEDLHYYLS